MQNVWLSTLLSIKKIDPTFQVPNGDGDENDRIIKLTPAQQENLLRSLQRLTYPNCNTCHKPICTAINPCACQTSIKYQQEYNSLMTQLTETEDSINTLIATPFRQSRNAYGFSSSVVSAFNLVLANLVKCTIVIAAPLLIVPALLLGIYVYHRGKSEEEKINAELQAECFDKKVSLLLKHQESVRLRQQNPHATQTLSSVPQTKIKPIKEKRRLIGNSISHFIVSGGATVAMTYAAIKFGFLATLVAVGGPIAWGMALGIGILVGCYFGYKRYQHLSRKIEVEKKLARLAATDNNLNTLKKEIELTKSPSPRHDEKHNSTPKMINRLSSADSKHQQKPAPVMPPALHRSKSIPHLPSAAKAKPALLARSASASHLFGNTAVVADEKSLHLSLPNQTREKPCIRHAS